MLSVLEAARAQDLDMHFYTHADTQQKGWGHCCCMAQAVTPTPLPLLVSGQLQGPWIAVIVVVVVLLILLSAGILWFIFCR